MMVKLRAYCQSQVPKPELKRPHSCIQRELLDKCIHVSARMRILTAFLIYLEKNHSLVKVKDVVKYMQEMPSMNAEDFLKEDVFSNPDNRTDPKKAKENMKIRYKQI